MKVLSVETSTAICGTAVVEEGQVRAERWIEAPRIHSEKLLSLVDEVLASTHTELQNVDGIAVAIGPGSFTGLRIGLSVAKGLAFAVDTRLVAVPTLEALAWNVVRRNLVGQDQYILPMIDARRDEVYTALYYYKDGTLNELRKPHAALMGEIGTMIPGCEPVMVTGDGAGKFLQHCAAAGGKNPSRFTAPPRDQCLCSPAMVGLLGERKLIHGEAPGEIASLEPLYVKGFEMPVTPQHLGVQS